MAQISGHGNQSITSGHGYDDTAQLMTRTRRGKHQPGKEEEDAFADYL